MKILLIIENLSQVSEFISGDIYASIKKGSEAEIQIFNLSESDSNQTLPPNFKVRYKKLLNADIPSKSQYQGLFPDWLVRSFNEAENLANQAVGELFDIVQVCSNANVALLLRQAFSRKGIRVAKYILANKTNKSFEPNLLELYLDNYLEKLFTDNNYDFIERANAWYIRIEQQSKNDQGSFSELSKNDLNKSNMSEVDRSLGRIYQQLSQLPENNAEQIAQKLQMLWDINSLTYCDRVTNWSEITRLERVNDNISYAVVYQLRTLRNLNFALDSSVSEMQTLLRQASYTKEAEVLARMYHKDPTLDLPFESFSKNYMFLPNFAFEHRVDHRNSITPKVSVIVSMYNADNKLEVFLRWMADQTLHKQGLLEVVLIDSASPGKELEVVNRLQKELKLSILYVRSKSKETIQTAWNQGISVSRAPYLCFLGVDESVRPDALEILASKLDTDSSVDWVTGSSVAYDVDWSGNFKKQTLFYNRVDSVHDQIFFDTTQLSWVGALYRRTIHNRFGFYDGTFTAAGDTEFKNRVFGNIKAHFIPDILGFYLNYPEARMTEHPRAEIEDLRALYWYKTPGGVAYSYRNKSVEELEAQVRRTLVGFRKTFYSAASTDIDYAYSALKALELRAPASPLLALTTGVDKIKAAFAAYEYVFPFSQAKLESVQNSVTNVLKEVQKQHSIILAAPDLVYTIERDNRFQYYNNPWRH